MNAMHEIDYKIHGDDMQFVEVALDPQEAVVAEAGGMMYMDDSIAMETIFGDGSAQNSGIMGALLGAGKRLLTGESLFMTVFQNQGAGKKKVAFGAPYPGKILPVKLSDLGGELIVQKDSFLCAAKGVSVGIAFQKRLGAGLFGGEGFIMQRLTGDGWTFIHAGGTLLERTLAPGETLRVDTGCIVGFQPTVDYDIQLVGGIKTALFGGEGLFFATLRGPAGVTNRRLHDLAGLVHRVHGHTHVLDPIQRIKDAEHVHTGLRRLLHEILHHVVGIVLVAHRVRGAQQHLLHDVGHGGGKIREPLPGILAQVSQRHVEGGSAPGFHRKQLRQQSPIVRRNGEHVAAAHACGHQ